MTVGFERLGSIFLVFKIQIYDVYNGRLIFAELRWSKSSV